MSTQKNSSGNAGWTKRVNRSLLLREIWLDGPISRAELAIRTELSPATVTSLTEQMLRESLIQEVGKGVSRGGRKPILLSVNPGARLAVGMEVTTERVLGSLMNLHCDIVESFEAPVRLESAAAFVESLAAVVAGLLAKDAARAAPVVGIGVACPGLIDVETAELRYSSSLGLERVPVGRELERRFGLPVAMHKGMNMSALAENQLGAGKGEDHLVYVLFDRQIGLGLVMDGRMYMGPQGGAGEIGHMTVEINGPYCRCGNRGCLCVLGSGESMVANAARLVGQGADTILATYCNGDPAQLTIEHVLEGIEAGDRLARTLFNETVEYLAAGIANVVNLLGPRLIAIGGRIVRRHPDLVVQSLYSGICKRALPGYRDEVKVLQAELGSKAAELGAGLMAIRRYLNVEGVALSKRAQVSS